MKQLTNIEIADCVGDIKPYPIELMCVPAEQVVSFVRNIEDKLSAQDEQDDWISVYDAKPEIGVEVLVWISWGDWACTESPSVDIWDYHPKTKELIWRSDFGGAVSFTKITHWKKAPTGPKR